MGASGICKLTGVSGSFVKSHIIPRAYTNQNLDKNIRIELGQFGDRPKIRHDSWYDSQLVTFEGEKILADYDEAFALQAKKFGLCWRHHPIKNYASQSQSEKIFGTSLCKFSDLDSQALRKFFLSLLWRSTNTSLPGFKEIRLDVMSRTKLSRIVSGQVQPHPTDFPITLVALNTKGQPQNLSPIRDKIFVPQIADGLKSELKIFRFFVDGLIAHIGRKSMDAKLRECWRGRVLGVDSPTVIVSRPYEGSWQEQNIQFLQEELHRDWPVQAEKIYGKLKNG